MMEEVGADEKRPGHQLLGRALAEIRKAQPSQDMRYRIVAVDGPGGAGKSTLSDWLARELDAPVVRTDDFASWDNPIDWWPNLLEQVLKPLAAGRPARYVPTSWGGPKRQEITVDPQDFVVLEGVSASRDAFRPYLAYSIWIETPRDLRLERGVERDGEAMRAQWEKWMAEEDGYIKREHPAERADLVLPGDSNLWVRDDPETPDNSAIR